MEWLSEEIELMKWRRWRLMIVRCICTSTMIEGGEEGIRECIQICSNQYIEMDRRRSNWSIGEGRMDGITTILHLWIIANKHWNYVHADKCLLFVCFLLFARVNRKRHENESDALTEFIFILVSSGSLQYSFPLQVVRLAEGEEFIDRIKTLRTTEVSDRWWI